MMSEDENHCAKSVTDGEFPADYKTGMRTVKLVMVLLLVTAAADAQRTTPAESKLCQQQPSGGIVVTFNPPLGDALLVPNVVTVDVPLELHPTKVSVQSYPLGTEMGGVPSEIFAEMSRFHKVGTYARFKVEIKKCTDEGGLHVLVFCKGFEHDPLYAGVGGAIECRPIDSDSTHPPPTK